MTAEREQGVTRAFVALARSLADGLDPVDLLTGLAEDAARLLDVASTGILLATRAGCCASSVRPTAACARSRRA